MVNALILLVFIEFLANEGTAIRCEFPSPDMTEAPIRVLLEPRPSLKDQPGLYRVMMRMDNGTALKALADDGALQETHRLLAGPAGPGGARALHLGAGLVSPTRPPAS